VAHDARSWERLRLSTDRLCLRTPTSADADALYGLFADAEVMHGLGRRPVSDLGEVGAMIDDGLRGWSTDGVGPFVLETEAAAAIRDWPMRLGPSSGSSR
jgi:RimJ/RimL family protein N-acetyltransferase